ncbi:hypothetical protein Q5752_005307 [Cryptotrichosporon argae]
MSELNPTEQTFSEQELNKFFDESLEKLGDMPITELSKLLSEGFVFEPWHVKSAEILAASSCVSAWLTKLRTVILADKTDYNFEENCDEQNCTEENCTDGVHKAMMRMWDKNPHKDAPPVWKKLHSLLHSDQVTAAIREAVGAGLRVHSHKAYKDSYRQMLNALPDELHSDYAKPL